MAGKFLSRGALVQLIKSQERTNAFQKREGLTQHPVRTMVCGCSDLDCGGWHAIVTEKSVPTKDECSSILRHDKSKRKGQLRMAGSGQTMKMDSFLS